MAALVRIPQKEGMIERTANFDGGLEFQEDGLGDEDFSRLHAEAANFLGSQLHLLARSASSDLQESFDNAIYINVSHFRSLFLMWRQRRMRRN